VIICNHAAAEEVVAEALQDFVDGKLIKTTSIINSGEDTFVNLANDYFSNPLLSIDFYQGWSRVIPLDSINHHHYLSRNPQLCPKFVVESKDKLSMPDVLKHNLRLPTWLVQRVIRKTLNHD
jgi:hypothetical protein